VIRSNVAVRLLADAREGPGDTRFQPPLIVAADVALCSFQGPRRGIHAGRASRSRYVRGLATAGAPVSQNSTACWTFGGR